MWRGGRNKRIGREGKGKTGREGEEKVDEREKGLASEADLGPNLALLCTWFPQGPELTWVL